MPLLSVRKMDGVGLLRILQSSHHVSRAMERTSPGTRGPDAQQSSAAKVCVILRGTSAFQVNSLRLRYGIQEIQIL